MSLVGSVDQDGELVAAEPSHGVARAELRLEAFGDDFEQLVARVVAQAVIHLLEAVEVDQQNGENTTRSLGARERLVETVTEERAVRHPGQAVVERLPGQLLLEPDALADVPRVEDNPADLPVRAKVGHVGLEVPPLAEAVQQPEDDLRRLPVRVCRDEREIVGVNEAGEVLPEQLPLVPSEHLRNGLTRVAAAALSEHEHEVGRRVNDAAEMRRLAPGRGDQCPAEQQ